MASKHTPGPCKARDYFVMHGNSIIGEAIRVGDSDSQTQEAKANAALWAEAPAMLEALRDVVDRLSHPIYKAGVQVGESAVIPQRDCDALRAILARIDGGHHG